MITGSSAIFELSNGKKMDSVIVQLIRPFLSKPGMDLAKKKGKAGKIYTFFLGSSPRFGKENYKKLHYSCTHTPA